MPHAVANDNTLDGPIEGLTNEQNKRFLSGDVAFNDEIFNASTGLGPMFVATSCGTCHAGDGKGHPFSTLVRFGQADTLGNLFLHLGGPQLQGRAIPGILPETVPQGTSSSKFTPPANSGLGFFEAIADKTLMTLADPNDADGDGISGRVNWINIPTYSSIRPGSIVSNGRYIGRFGKKAAVYDLHQQTANAYNQDMGISSSYEPFDTYTGQSIDPEISNIKMLDVVFYLQTLKAPIQRNRNDQDVKSGAQVFTKISCGKCHTPTIETGHSFLSPLSNQTIHPYTDLLLHDMGPQLNDGYTEGTALPEEWRTPALWGLGLSKSSQGGAYFLMHDGRAHSIDEAIDLHSGEASFSKSAYKKLSETEKKQLLKFLESL